MTITGEIRDTTNQPRPGLLITFRPKNSLMRNRPDGTATRGDYLVTTVITGRFELDLTAGGYEVLIDKDWIDIVVPNQTGTIDLSALFPTS